MSDHARRLRSLVALATSTAFAVACHQSGGPNTSASPAPAPSAETIASAPDTVSAQDPVTEGRKIFHGKGLCYACHGGRLQGGPVAPALAGAGRNMKDTSFAYILQVVRAGSPHTPMVANQGGIDAGEMVQVANYVWAVSNQRTVP